MAKHSYKLKIEEHFNNNSDPRRMWQGIQAITDYKPTNTSPQTGEASLPDELNSFYARFDRDNQQAAIKAALTTDNQPLTLSSTDVCAALSRTNARKAAGPDGIPGRVLRACAGQLTEVLTDLFTCHWPKQLSPRASRPPPSCRCQNTPKQRALMTFAQLHSLQPS